VTTKESLLNRPLIRTFAVLALLLAACGGSDAGNATTVPNDPSTTIAFPDTTTLPPSTTTTTQPTTTTAPTTTTVPSTTTEPSPTTTAPADEPTGAAVDFGPAAGDVLGVIGVAHDDVLNVRRGPGTGYEVVATLDPMSHDVVAAGNTWRMPSGSYWIEVDAEGKEGWVNLAYVAYLADTTDITAYAVEELGELPGAETMLELGMLIADALAPVDGEFDVDVVASVAPTVGDLGEITFDVVGSGDDSVRGVRLHVFGTPSESGEGFVLKSVEATPFCDRGVADGVCT
jgi:hypothetical protein